MSGATIANGAMVSARYRMTRGRAASTDTLKNSDPASDTAKKASALVLMAWAWARRANGIGPKTRRSAGLAGLASLAWLARLTSSGAGILRVVVRAGYCGGD